MRCAARLLDTLSKQDDLPYRDANGKNAGGGIKRMDATLEAHNSATCEIREFHEQEGLTAVRLASQLSRNTDLFLVVQTLLDAFTRRGRKLLRLGLDQSFLVLPRGVMQKPNLFSITPAPFAKQQMQPKAQPL